MRVSTGIHLNDIESVEKLAILMFKKFLTHATPTLFNVQEQNLKCHHVFFWTMKEYSADGIYDTPKQTARIGQSAGIGLQFTMYASNGVHI
jgi:ribonucleoside-diphosphate reductase alpha chain